MALRKLTLSIDSDVIEKARQVSKRRRTSVSALFSNYVATIDDAPKTAKAGYSPLTRRALELSSGTSPLPKDWDYRSELADILMEKYGVK